ncbi:hypothetical protein HZS_2551 [Henneguya salminicola]|nr:hypothetical protein HZS_2551 [Henneguya salminicola]
MVFKKECEAYNPDKNMLDKPLLKIGQVRRLSDRGITGGGQLSESCNFSKEPDNFILILFRVLSHIFMAKYLLPQG